MLVGSEASKHAAGHAWGAALAQTRGKPHIHALCEGSQTSVIGCCLPDRAGRRQLHTAPKLRAAVLATAAERAPTQCWRGYPRCRRAPRRRRWALGGNRVELRAPLGGGAEHRAAAAAAGQRDSCRVAASALHAQPPPSSAAAAAVAAAAGGHGGGGFLAGHQRCGAPPGALGAGAAPLAQRAGRVLRH